MGALKDVTDTQPDFATFVVERQRALLRLAMVLCGDARQAEDIVADVLGRAFERWARIAAVDRPDAYVRRMVVNEFLSWRRRIRRTTPYDTLDDLLDAAPDPAEGRTDRITLVDQLAELPRRQRATLVLRYFEGLSDREIAAVLGCAESTVRSNAARGLARLRISLTPDRVPPMPLPSLTKET